MASPSRAKKRQTDQRYKRLWDKRKLVTVACDPVVFSRMFIFGGSEVTAKGLPIDCLSFGWQYEPKSLSILFIYGHEKFKSIPVGEELPKIEVEFKRAKNNDTDTN